MTQQYDNKLKHKQEDIAISLALKSGRSVKACREWLNRLRLGYAGYAPVLNKSDWGYILGKVYYNDKGRDKIAANARTMRGATIRKTTA